MIHLIFFLPSQAQLAGLIAEVVSASGVPAPLRLPSPIPRSQHRSAHLTSAPYTNGLQWLFLFKKTEQLVFCISLLKMA